MTVKVVQNYYRTLDKKLIYEHNNGIRSRVKLYQAGLGIRKIRIANFPPETQVKKIRQVLNTYGFVIEVVDDAYRHQSPAQQELR
jgi:Na+-translocating ferredoxin:NAD+ oxidoreductase RnfC subunit